MASAFILPRQTVVNGSGVPYAGAKLYIYQANTTTPIAVYTTPALDVPAPNPLTANDSGRFDAIYVDEAVYDAVGYELRTAAGTFIESLPEVPTSGLTAASVGRALYPRTADEQAAGVTVSAYQYPPGTLRRYGATGDGAADDVSALAAACAVGGEIRGTDGDVYRIRSGVTISSETKLVGGDWVFKFDFPTTLSNAEGALFNVAASKVTFDGVRIDAAGVTGTITGVNRYAIRVEPSGSTRYSDIRVQGCRFTNLAQISGTIPATTTVMHAIYAKQVDDLRVLDNVFDTISGACVFLVSTKRAKVRGNDCIKHGWTGVWMNNDNVDWDIDGNTFSGTTAANPSYWGGAIDIMGQTSDGNLPGNVDQRGTITNNKFIGGVYRYGQVVRLSSSRGVVVKGNIFDQCNADDNATAGSGAAGSHNHYIVATVRDVTLNNGPHKFLTISNNIFRAAGAGWQIPIYLITTSGTNTNTTACEGVVIEGNQFESVDGSNYFQSAVVLHGFNSGYRDILIRGNNIKCTPNAVANYIPASLPGAIVMIANSGKTVQRVTIKDNIFERYAGAGAANADTAVYIYSDVTDVEIEGNTFHNFYRDITVDSGNAGTVPVLYNLHNRNATGSDWLLRGVAYNYSTASATYDPANLVDGAGVTTSLTATGARAGDLVTVSFSTDLAGVTLTGWVSSNDTVSVRFQNETGGAVDLASGTLRASVRKP